jgi:LPS sulfotransferase NodH
MVKQFVLLFEGRTGSTFLREVLSRHPGVLAEEEQLRHFKQAENGAARQLDWARQFLTPPLFGPHHLRGFKTKLHDVLDQPGFAQLLREKRVRIVCMQRQNRVKLTVSRFNGQRLNNKTDNWNLYRETDRQGAITIDVAKFDAALRQREQREQALEGYIQALGQPTVTVYYEDLLRDREAFLSRVYDFLDLRSRPVTTHVIKNTSDDLRNVLQNFDELRAHYAGTPYAPMFDEVLVPDEPGR